ncbi:MAG TPA: twin-arginine translocase subunit TatC [Actinophytocola sp.]|nr:twin-arginine translocase subunit TatC [Actinophytocola sp.]HET9140478.1 twin-arginine translocase subunit TatC [Actinophytocola sp.]
MTLRDHIYELRHRLGLAVLFILLGGVLGFLWFGNKIGPIPSLGDLMTGPYCALPAPEVRFEPNPGQCQLLQTQPFEAFLIQFKVGVAAGAVLTAPLWLYQVWAFITPGLYARERKFALTFVAFGSALFACGAALAYFVVPKGLEVLVNFGGDNFITALAANDYISFVLVMLLIFGVCFELPLLVVMLNRVGIVSYNALKRHRRGILFGLFVFAAFATPGTDPVSMIALAVALTVLLEVAIQVARIHDRRKAAREAAEGFGELSDDEPSPMNYSPEPVQPSPTPEARAGLDDVT